MFGSDDPGTRTGPSTWEPRAAYLLNGEVTDRISGTRGVGVLLTTEMKAQLPLLPGLGHTTVRNNHLLAHQKQTLR